MTENEAREFLRRFSLDRIGYARGKEVDTERFNYFTEVLMAAMQALTEIQQYRAIGTVEEIKKVVKFLSLDNDNGIIEDLQLLNEYQLVGTVEECREARERHRGKKPEWSPDCEECEKDGTLDCTYKCGSFSTLSSVLVCPNCKKQRVIKEHGHRYCNNCGQAIDWSDTQ